jgi:hypothetical protein
VLGTIDLGGVPEQGVADGKGMLYVVMQDMPGSVTAVDVKTMKAVGHYSLGDKGRCNGLAIDAKNGVLFAACANSGNPPAQPAVPMMVILSAADGKIITSLPLAGGSDGAVFNPATMEAFSTHGNGTLTVVKEKSPTSFEVEQNLQTMNGARTITLDSKTNHILTMSQERGPAPPPPPTGGRGGQGRAVPGSFTNVPVTRPQTAPFSAALSRHIVFFRAVIKGADCVSTQWRGGGTARKLVRRTGLSDSSPVSRSLLAERLARGRQLPGLYCAMVARPHRR